ncbi:MAG: glycosyl hydrolase [bacterium]
MNPFLIILYLLLFSSSSYGTLLSYNITNARTAHVPANTVNNTYPITQTGQLIQPQNYENSLLPSTHEFWTPLTWNFNNNENNLQFPPLSLNVSPNTGAFNTYNASPSNYNTHFKFTFNTFPYLGLTRLTNPLDNDTSNGLDSFTYNNSDLLFIGYNPIISDSTMVIVQGLHKNSPTKIIDYGLWQVTTKTTDPSNENTYIKMTYGHGSPFIFCESNGITSLNILLTGGPRLWYNADNTIAFSRINYNFANHFAAFFQEGSQTAIHYQNQELGEISSIDIYLPDNHTQFFTLSMLPDQINSHIYLAPTNKNNGNGPLVTPTNLSHLTQRNDYEPNLIVNLRTNFFGVTNNNGQAYPGGIFDNTPSFIHNNSISHINNMIEILMNYRALAFNFISNTTLDWRVENKQLTSTYTVETTKKISQNSFNYHTFSSPTTSSNQTKNYHSHHTFIALYPHQWLHTSHLKENSFESINGQFLYTGSETQNQHDLYTYQSTRGPMKVQRGNSIETTLNFIGYIPFFPTLNESLVPQLNTYLNNVTDNENLQAPERLLQTKSDPTYTTGKKLNKIAQLLPLAQTYHPEKFSELKKLLKTELLSWTSASISEKSLIFTHNGNTAPDNTSYQLFVYNEDWKTLIGFPSDFSTAKEIQDHHFHYGYFISAAATLLRYEPDLINNSDLIELINELIMDVSYWEPAFTNIPQPRQYPTLRSFDPFLGFSLANGNSDTGSGNNQESSSESLNYAAAVINWGAEINNDKIRNLGIYLYSTELSAIEQYWFNKSNITFPKNIAYQHGPENNNHISENTNFEHESIGIVWTNKTDYGTWFAFLPTFIQGINYLPITPHSLYLKKFAAKINTLYDKLVANEHLNYFYDYHQKVSQDFINKNGPENAPSTFLNLRRWSDIHWQALALANPGKAKSEFNQAETINNGQGYFWENTVSTNQTTPISAIDNKQIRGEAGESKAHTYHWIEFMNHYGTPTFSVTIDYPLSMVFEKGSTLNYVAYNPKNHPISVSFTRNNTQHSLQIPAKSMKTMAIDLTNTEANTPDNSSTDTQNELNITRCLFGPNPFNPHTQQGQGRFEIHINKPASIHIRIYTLSGQKVDSFIKSARNTQTGKNILAWPTTQTNIHQLGNAVYIAIIDVSNSHKKIRKKIRFSLLR